MRLLVVEDEHSLREDIARKLRLSGYEVDACADGEAALEALAAERYDLVLLDLNLPKVDGMQVLRSFLPNASAMARQAMPCSTQNFRTPASGLDSVRPSFIIGCEKYDGLKSRPRPFSFAQSIQRAKCFGSSSLRLTGLPSVSA